MKIFIVANLDQDWGIDLHNAHKTRLQAEISLDIIKKSGKCGCEYSDIYEMELEE